MPEMYFTVRWPDGQREHCYSPSLVVTEHLEVGQRYALADFVARATLALEEASRRVQLKYGFACSSAIDQLERIRLRAGALADHPEGFVHVEGFSPGAR